MDVNPAREDDRLGFEKAEMVKRRLKERFRRVPKTIDMTSELLAQRRREAAEENGG